MSRATNCQLRESQFVTTSAVNHKELNTMCTVPSTRPSNRGRPLSNVVCSLKDIAFTSLPESLTCPERTVGISDRPARNPYTIRRNRSLHLDRPERIRSHRPPILGNHRSRPNPGGQDDEPSGTFGGVPMETRSPGRVTATSAASSRRVALNQGWIPTVARWLGHSDGGRAGGDCGLGLR